MKKIILTIDDAPSEKFKEKCNFLIKENIPAVFFCSGSNLLKYKEDCVYAINNGFVIGNHSFNHITSSKMKLRDLFQEILTTDKIIDELYNVANVERKYKWFRFPYGDKGDYNYGRIYRKPYLWGKIRKNKIQKFLKTLGYSQINFPKIEYDFMINAGLMSDVDWSWTFDVAEWALELKHPPLEIKSEKDIIQRLNSNEIVDVRNKVKYNNIWFNNPSASEIVLTHDNVATHSLFERIVKNIKSKNCVFVLPK